MENARYDLLANINHNVNSLKIMRTWLLAIIAKSSLYKIIMF